MRKKVTRMTIFLFLSKRKPNSIDLSIDTGYLKNVLHNVFLAFYFSEHSKTNRFSCENDGMYCDPSIHQMQLIAEYQD